MYSGLWTARRSVLAAEKLGESLELSTEIRHTPLQESNHAIPGSAESLQPGIEDFFMSTEAPLALPFLKQSVGARPEFRLSLPHTGAGVRLPWSAGANGGKTSARLTSCGKRQGVPDRLLIEAKLLLVGNGGTGKKARAAFRAVAADVPKGLHALRGRSIIFTQILETWKKALEAARESVRLRPGSIFRLRPSASHTSTLTRLDEAEAVMKQAGELEFGEASWAKPATN